MGTSRNQRSPADLRWRVVQAAYTGGSAPRAVSELFRAAGTDGWLASLASPACAAYAAAAVEAHGRLPDVLRERQTAGAAVRAVVDDARRASLEMPSFPDAGLMPGLAERALARVLIMRLQSPGQPLSAMPLRVALTNWKQASSTPPTTLAAAQLVETVRQVVLHLVHRDGPSLVGQRALTSADVNGLATSLADAATVAASTGAELLRQGGLRAWPAASEAAWEAARDLASSASSLGDGGQRP